jgi:hypothetical protein
VPVLDTHRGHVLIVKSVRDISAIHLSGHCQPSHLAIAATAICIRSHPRAYNYRATSSLLASEGHEAMSETTSWLGLLISIVILLFGNGLCYRRTKPNANALVSLVIAALTLAGLYYLWAKTSNAASAESSQVKRSSSVSEEPYTLPVKLEPPRADAMALDITFEEFASTLASLSAGDRTCYLESIAAKNISWTGYVSQVHLAENYLYLSEHRDPATTVNVAVWFPQELRSQIAPVGKVLRVKGAAEIRGPWVVVHASELTRVR